MDPYLYLLVTSVFVAYQTPTLAPLSVNVELVNAAGLPDRLVKDAQKEASRIFSTSQVHLAWIHEPEDDSSPHLKVLITSDEFGTNRIHGVMWVLGKAPSAGEDHRNVALVSYPSVLRSSFTYRISAQQMLGAVIVHEVAHLLLPRGWHDRQGVMRRAWDSTDFQLLSMRQLGFAAVSANLLRAGVERTMHRSLDRTSIPMLPVSYSRRYEP